MNKERFRNDSQEFDAEMRQAIRDDLLDYAQELRGSDRDLVIRAIRYIRHLERCSYHEER